MNEYLLYHSLYSGSILMCIFALRKERVTSKDVLYPLHGGAHVSYPRREDSRSICFSTAETGLSAAGAAPWADGRRCRGVTRVLQSTGSLAIGGGGFGSAGCEVAGGMWV